MAPTMEIETVQVTRPIKVIAFVCGLVAVILLIVAISSNSWVEADDYRQGLWKICTYNYDGDIDECSDPDSDSKGWMMGCAVLGILSLVVCVAGIILTGFGLWSKDHTKKYKIYKAATYTMFSAFVLQLVPLIIFPIMFIQDLDQKSAEMQIYDWYFAWSYGIGWGADIFELGAAVLLLIDKDNEEIYYKEKTTYRDDDA